MRLPSAYQEVTYIQSSGTQYIDTGYIVNSSTKVEADIQFTGTTNQRMVFGIGSDTNTSSGVTFCIYIGGGGYWSCGMGNGVGTGTWSNSSVAANTNRNKFVLSNGKFEVYDSGGTKVVDITTTNTISSTATHSMGIFSRYEMAYNSFRNLSSGKLYSFKIYEGTSLVRDFVPCYKKSDGEIGLYDLVNDVFYTNQGTGAFAKGPDFKGGKISKGYLWVGEPKIPSEYQEVEYIQSDGGQYIDTGVSKNTVSLPIIEYVFYTDTKTNDCGFLGHWSTGGYIFGESGTNGNEFRFTAGGTNGRANSGVAYSTGKHTFTTDTSYAYLDGTRMTGNGGNMTIYAGTICLFRAGGGFNVPNGNVRVYYCKISDTNGNVIREMIPCYRKSDNVIGMYDKVEGQFYTNQGSGTFTKGNDVEPTYIFVEKQFYPGGGGGGGFVFEYDFTTKTKAEAIADGWHGEGGGDWSVSSAGAYFSRAQTDRSYVVSHPITLPSTVNTMYLKSRFRGDVYSWAGTYSTTIKQTYTCGSGNVYPNDDYIQSCYASYNSNSGYQGYGTGCEPVTQSGVGSSNSIGSDWIDVESFYDLKNMTGWGKITRVSDGVQLWTQSFSLNDISRITSKLGQDVYVCLFFRNGTYDNKWCKNVRVEIT